MEQLPPLVAAAEAVARQMGFPLTREEAGPERASACLPGVGRFLAVLAAGCVGGRIGELGTGAGIGAAWIASAMPADCTLVTAEIDEELAQAAQELLAGDVRIEVFPVDALRLMPERGPFDLLFADSGVRGQADFAALVGVLRIGGRIVMDDVTPEQALPAGSPLRSHDVKRQLFGQEPRLVTTEVVLPDLRHSLLAGTRIS